MNENSAYTNYVTIQPVVHYIYNVCAQLFQNVFEHYVCYCISLKL